MYIRHSDWKGCYFAHSIFNYIYVNTNVWTLFNITPTSDSRDTTDNKWALVHVVAWYVQQWWSTGVIYLWYRYFKKTIVYSTIFYHARLLISQMNFSKMIIKQKQNNWSHISNTCIMFLIAKRHIFLRAFKRIFTFRTHHCNPHSQITTDDLAAFHLRCRAPYPEQTTWRSLSLRE